MFFGKRETPAWWARKNPPHRRPKRRRPRRHNGHADGIPVAPDRTRIRRRGAAGGYAVVARDCPLLPAEVARGGRARLAAGVLGRDWLWIRHILPLRRRTGPAALHGLLLSRRAHHDRALHLDLHHDVRH